MCVVRLHLSRPGKARRPPRNRYAQYHLQPGQVTCRRAACATQQEDPGFLAAPLPHGYCPHTSLWGVLTLWFLGLPFLLGAFSSTSDGDC